MNDTYTDEDIPLTPLPADDAPPPADASVDLVELDPARVRLFRTGGSVVRATITDPQLGAARSFLRVQIARGFPLSDPDHYIGLRDEKDKDIGMLVTLTGLEASSRAVVEEELTRRYFIPKIQSVSYVKDEFGSITWEVETDKGARKFIVQNLKESVQNLTPTRILIVDKDGTRYEIPDVRKLDTKTFAVIQRVL